GGALPWEAEGGCTILLPHQYGWRQERRMGYQVTARKWRPQTFDDVVEQRHVTRTLRNAIRLGRIAHAYLFAGTRGVGKTTMARVFAIALTCEQGPTEDLCNVC